MFCCVRLGFVEKVWDLFGSGESYWVSVDFLVLVRVLLR